MTKQGWYELGGWYLTPKAICKEFNLTEEQLKTFFDCPLSKKVDGKPFYPRVHSSYSVSVWKLDDLKVMIPIFKFRFRI